MAQDEKLQARLVRLSDTELTVADPAEDVRGRTGMDKDGGEIGENFGGGFDMGRSPTNIDDLPRGVSKGGFDVDLSLSPLVTAEQVTFANAPWGSREELVIKAWLEAA